MRALPAEAPGDEGRPPGPGHRLGGRGAPPVAEWAYRCIWYGYESIYTPLHAEVVASPGQPGQRDISGAMKVGVTCYQGQGQSAPCEVCYQYVLVVYTISTGNQTIMERSNILYQTVPCNTLYYLDLNYTFTNQTSLDSDHCYRVGVMYWQNSRDDQDCLDAYDGVNYQFYYVNATGP